MAIAEASHAPDFGPADGSVHADRVAVKALARIFKAWRISLADAAKLVGVSERTWSRMKDDTWAGALDTDQVARASAIVGVYKGLHLYFGEDLADRWVKLRNRGPLFDGVSPLDHMISGGLLAIINTRDYIEAIRGGM